MAKRKKKAIDLPKQVSEESKTNKREEQKKQQQKQQQQWHTQQSTINSSALKLSFFHWRIYIPTHLLESALQFDRTFIWFNVARSVMLLLFQFGVCVCWWWWDCCCRHRIEIFFRKRRPTEKNCTQNKMRKKKVYFCFHSCERSRCANSKPPDE